MTFVFTGKDLRKKCPAIGSPVTPVALLLHPDYLILVALNVVTLSHSCGSGSVHRNRTMFFAHSHCQ